MKPTLEASTFVVRENCSAQFSGFLCIEDGKTPIPSGTLTSLTARLTDYATGQIINGRDSQSVLNSNGGAIDGTTGKFVWTMAPADNPIVGNVSDGEYETHELLFVWTWSSGTKRGARRYFIRVQRIA